MARQDGIARVVTHLTERLGPKWHRSPAMNVLLVFRELWLEEGITDNTLVRALTARMSQAQKDDLHKLHARLFEAKRKREIIAHIEEHSRDPGRMVCYSRECPHSARSGKGA